VSPQALELDRLGRCEYTRCTQVLREAAMAGQLIRVGVREFREDLAEYLDSPTPVAITRHGQTVGYYIPARGDVDQRELVALKQAVEQLAALLAEHGVSEDEVVGEFRARRART
jgi:hypothetical protein